MAQPVFRVGYDVAFEDAIDQARRRQTVLPDVYYGQMQGIARTQAFSVAGITSLAQIRHTLNTLTEALRSGQSFDDWKRAVRAGKIALDLPNGRLDNIFRTNIQTAYNRGIWERQKQDVTARPLLMYDAINDSRTRPTHRAMDNYIAPADDPVWQVWYPPNGYRCRCRVIGLSKSEAMARGWGSQPRPQVLPDEGWDYDIRQAPLIGVKRAVAQAISEAPPKIARAANDAIVAGQTYDITEWRAIPGTQKGSNPGGLFEAPDGTQWYVKLPANADHARSEVAAGLIHKALGINVPESMLIVREGRVGIASRWVDGMQRVTAEVMATQHADDLARIYQASIITKNWDAVGLNYDNILRGPDGKLWMIDSGASFRFRAQGAAKPFGRDIAERTTFLDPSNNAQSAALFGRLVRDDPWWEWKGQRALAKLDPEATRKTFVGVGFSPRGAKDLAEATVWRQRALRDLYDLDNDRIPPQFHTHIDKLLAILPKGRWDKSENSQRGVMKRNPSAETGTAAAMAAFERYADSLVARGSASIRIMYNRNWSGSSTSMGGGVIKAWAMDRFKVPVRFHHDRATGRNVVGAKADAAALADLNSTIQSSGRTRDELFALLDAEYAFTQWQLRKSVGWGESFGLFRAMDSAEFRTGMVDMGTHYEFSPNSVVSTSVGNYNFGGSYAVVMTVTPWDVGKTYWEGTRYMNHQTEIEFVLIGGTYRAVAISQR